MSLLSDIRLGLKTRRSIVAVGLLAGILLPLAVDSYVLRATSVFYIHLLLGIGLTIIVTYAGLLNLGYAAFFAIGAYSYALLNTYGGYSFFVVLPIGLLAAALFSLLLGFPTLRVRGDYLALVTLAFGEIIRILLLNIWGPHGISGIAPPMSAASVGGIGNLYLLFYFITFVPIPFAFYVFSRIDASKVSKSWFAIRDNEIASRSCGISSLSWLLLALVIGGAFAGISGVIFAGIQRFVSPGSFALEESIFILSIVVVAGGRSPWRLILAAGILSLLPEVMRDLAAYRMLIYGLLLSVFVVGEEMLKIGLRRSRAEGTSTGSDLARNISPAHKSSSLKGIGSERRDWVLSANRLTMRFGGLVAVNNVSFEIPLAGRIIGLIGPNGAGKTTLFNCITGFHQPTSGSISFPGAKQKRTPSLTARAGIGRTFQAPQLFHTMTVRENISTAAIWNKRAVNAAETVDGIIRYLGMEPVAEVKADLLPLGYQRLTELGRALALIPKVILIDELASGLNSREKQQMSELVRALSEKYGIGFLVVEHDMDFVLPLAAEILVLDSGKLISRGTPSEVTGDPAVIDAYLGSSYAAS